MSAWSTVDHTNWISAWSTVDQSFFYIADVTRAHQRCCCAGAGQGLSMRDQGDTPTDAID